MKKYSNYDKKEGAIMRKMKVCVLLVLFLLVTMVLSFFDSINFKVKIEADEAGWSEKEIEGEIGGGNGESYDKFTIVEIVPYRGMGEMNYLVGGQELVEEDRFVWKNANGDFSFLGGAITPYRSYQEAPLLNNGNTSEDWVKAQTFESQNGYFQYVGRNNGGRYNKNTNQDIYVRVENGKGSYRAKLVKEHENIYTGSWNALNYKNVNAYFVLGKPSGVALYSTTNAYDPYCVKRSSTNTGNYDYDSETETFYLNIGKGEYDVTFIRKPSHAKSYYMMANYQVVDDFTGEYSWDLSYEYVGNTGGNYNKVNGMTFDYKEGDEWNYCYKWVLDNQALRKPNYFQEGTPETTSEKIWVQGQKILKNYQYGFKVTLVNNEIFKRICLGIPSRDVKNVPVEVITITPENLNKNQHIIEKADLFYINASYNHNRAYLNLYESFSTEGVNLPADKKYYNNEAKRNADLNFAVNDLSWSSVVKIVKRAAGADGRSRAGVVMDRLFYLDAINGSGKYSGLRTDVTVGYSWNGTSATTCNVAKLFIMLYQRDVLDFYNAFLNPETSSSLIEEVPVPMNRNVTKSTGSYIRPDGNYQKSSNQAIFWNGNTFVPYGLNENGDFVRYSGNNSDFSKYIPNFNITAGGNNLINNVLQMNGQDIFTSKFMGRIDLSTGMDQAILYLTSINPNFTVVKAEEVTIAKAVRVILNYYKGPISGSKNKIRVLNLQPTADFKAGEINIRQMLSQYTVEIVNMTSVEFNGSILDINTNFDLIYMGEGVGRFNLNGSNTVFNNTSLNGSIYHGGDTINTTIAGTRYTGNDITSQKKLELEDFLGAGFPIIADNIIYQANSSHIKQGTNILGFITSAKGSYPNNFLNYSNFTSDNTSTKQVFLARLKAALEVERPTIKLRQPIVNPSSGLNYFYVNQDTGKLNIEFSLVPNGPIPSLHNYNSYLYIDFNGDGIFDKNTELLSAFSRDGISSWENIRENKLKAYTYDYDMSHRNGIYQWKILIERVGNRKIRSDITGYAAISKKENIRVLQIINNGEAYNLQNKSEDTASLIYRYTKYHPLKDYNIQFETLTVQQFQQLYAEKPYKTEDALATNKLSKYHLLILDNPNMPIDNTNGARSNIKDEIAKDLGVIYTKGSIREENQLQYVSSNKSSFLNQKTYPWLSRLATSGQKYIYAFDTIPSLNQDSTYMTRFITKANDGTITQYPYRINSAIKIANNSYSNEVTKDFNLSSGQPIVGWYCLSDSRSPVVRKEGLVNDGTQTDDKEYRGIYSSSPNDVKNNYYLFSNRNSFYSGIQLKASDSNGNDEEIKLFINTIIAAYRYTGRKVSNPPVIQIKHPVPVQEVDLSQSIMVTPADITNDMFTLIFQIKDSSSDMDVSVLWNNVDTNEGPTPGSNWHQIIYKVSADNQVTNEAIPINNGRKEIQNGTYGIKIPATELNGIHKLSIQAKNKEGNQSSTEVLIKFSQKPIVTLEKPIPIRKDTKQFIYVDLDYRSIDTGINDDKKFRMEIKINQAVSDVTLGLTTEGINLIAHPTYPVKVFPVVGGVVGTYELNITHRIPNGNYVIELPLSLMKDRNTREIMITATDIYGNQGDTKVNLLRRDLFPYD